MKALPVFAGCLALFAAADLSLGARFFGGFSVSLPHTFTSGSPALASEVNQNFSTIVTAVEARAFDVDTRLDELEPGANVLRVSIDGSGFTSVAAALATITDASASNPYLVEVGPGLFDETDLCSVPSFVTVRGAGPDATTIRSARVAGSISSASATLSLASNATLQDLGVENVGTTQSAAAIFGDNLSETTRLFNIRAAAEGTGGVEHVAIHVEEADLVIDSSRLVASGATTANIAFRCIDTSAAFSQPVLRDCQLHGDGITVGVGADIEATALRLDNCDVVGESVGIEARVNGSSRIVHSRIQTLGFNPVYSASGAASVLSGFTEFVGGNAAGLAGQFKYVSCAKANFDPVVNGSGSTVQ